MSVAGGSALGLAGLAATAASVVCALLAIDPDLLERHDGSAATAPAQVSSAAVQPPAIAEHEMPPAVPAVPSGEDQPPVASPEHRQAQPIDSHPAAPPTAGAAADSERAASDRNKAQGGSPATQACKPFEVGFAPASSRLDEDAEALLLPLTRWLAERPMVQLVVEGHADSRGGDDTNLRMSYDRARAVASVLSKGGVAKERMQLRGFGAYQPIVGVQEDDARQRRVVVSVTGSGECPPETGVAEGSQP